MKYHLLTGATGLLGRYLLRDLTLADVPLAVIVRASRIEPGAQRIETAMAHWEDQLGRALVRPVVLEGDITEPDLGMSSRDAHWVAQYVETVIHSAASLTFYADKPEGEPWRSNVKGTENVLELCRKNRIRQFHHVSTAYVCGRRREKILETELDVGQEPSNDYEQSKITAEKAVLSCGHFDQITVYRPSIIVGDSQNGYTSSFHGFYTPLRLGTAIAQQVSWETLEGGNWLGGLELEGHERKNLVPVDWVSAAMTYLITHPECHGHTYHLTNPRPVTVADMYVSMGLAIASTLGERAPQADRLQSEEMIASFREQMQVYQSYWSDDPEFDSSATEAALPHLPCPVIDDARMELLIHYAIDANFGWPKEAPVIPRHEIAGTLRPWLTAGEHLSAHDEERRYVNLRVSGSGGGQWRLILHQGRLIAAEEGLRTDHETICSLTSDTLDQLMNGSLSMDSAVRAGRVVVAGGSRDPRVLSRCLHDLMHCGPRQD